MDSELLARVFLHLSENFKENSEEKISLVTKTDDSEQKEKNLLEKKNSSDNLISNQNEKKKKLREEKKILPPHGKKNNKFQWMWQSPKGKWIPYGNKQNEEIEDAYLNGERFENSSEISVCQYFCSEIPVDDQRFVDFSGGCQRRFDDPTKARYVKRRGPAVVRKFYFFNFFFENIFFGRREKFRNLIWTGKFIFKY